MFIRIMGIFIFAMMVMEPRAEPLPVPYDAITSMTAALPNTARVAPKKARTILVYTYTNGFYHDSIPYAAKAIELMGVKTGAFTAVVTNDMNVFTHETLAQFDAIIMDNTTLEVFRPANFNDLSEEEKAKALEREQIHKESFREFVKNGGGLVGIHAATDCLYDWPDYGDMIGAYFISHPWNANVTVKVKLDEPGHPLCKAFEGRGFYITDEIYQFRDEPYSREKLRVLLSLDPSGTDYSLPGIVREDKDFAVSWVHIYGKGRVFYSSLGHNKHIFWNPVILQYYLDGIQFAMGDLEANADPETNATEK